MSIRKTMPEIGVVGTGLMGSSISACVLGAGHRVHGIDKSKRNQNRSKRMVSGYLKEMQKEGLLSQRPEILLKNYELSSDFEVLKDAGYIFEAITEDKRQKIQVIAKIEKFARKEAIIGSNTSAIPISDLQAKARNPERILGVHWAEPAHAMRFMEVICGDLSDIKFANKTVSQARKWGKDPALLRKDIRGFICNRLWYAMLREAFYLVEKGYTTPQDIDRSIRNDLGSWIALGGIFRYLDLTGIPAYHTVMKDLLPTLCNDVKVPKLMAKMVKQGARGTQNARGFYDYKNEREARAWDKSFQQITMEMHHLTEKYQKMLNHR